MEELLAYAYLWCEGLAVEEKYEEKLHELFLTDLTGSDDLLELDRNKFGKELMKLLKPIYRSMDIEKFGYRMYSLWEGLPGRLQDEDPFFILNCADDPPSWGDKRQTREFV